MKAPDSSGTTVTPLPGRLFLLLAMIFALGAVLPGCGTVRVPVAPGTTGQATEPSKAPLLFDPQAAQIPIFDAERLLLTSAYNFRHYGKTGFRLTDPQMIVVHYTAIATLQKTVQFFQPSELNREFRRDIASGGDVNVSAHYLVDSDGKLYQLAPEDVICRHTIGFNYTAIGIENIAADAEHLSELQAQATAGLISRMVGRHPSIRYLIGHHEYRDSALPHYRLLVEHDASYRFTDKIDPGPAFMARVRQLLKDVYGITLSD